ncbi:MAG: hypothetical protein LIQ30_11185 [Planctomycetes bacterium]|nr:hypothetical protein [Planctomycetota bacterium]
MGKICCAVLFLFLVHTAAPAIEAGALPLIPGERYNEPRQRGLDEVMEIPAIDLACPACGHALSVPAVDTLMRKPPYSDEPAPKWRMHALYRDSDLCPYPMPGKVAYQADIVVCPICGFAERLHSFANPVPREAVAWVNRNVTPEFQATLRHLLGQRAAEMTDAEILAFFSAQDAIPDTLRTELYRAYLAATHAPGLDRARAALQAAWATRRVVASRPDGAFLRKHTAAVTAEIGKKLRPESPVSDWLDALRGKLRRLRSARDHLPDAADIATRTLLAGYLDRQGFLDEAETILQEVYQEASERFLRPEQDPLWTQTSTRAGQAHRLNELEAIRRDLEQELFVRLEMIRREREQLAAAALAVRDAFLEGALDGKPDDALFWTYMRGEILRRQGDLPLANEWFKHLLANASPGSVIAAAATRQLELLDLEAGDRVNLLSALGRDGDLFERLRAILARETREASAPGGNVQ